VRIRVTSTPPVLGICRSSTTTSRAHAVDSGERGVAGRVVADHLCVWHPVDHPTQPRRRYRETGRAKPPGRQAQLTPLTTDNTQDVATPELITA
jgi:hypothetical protein